MNRAFLLAIIVVIAAFFCSCERPTGPGLPPALSVTIVKFKDPSYANNLIVNDYGKDKEFILMRGNRCSAGYLKDFMGKDWTYNFEPMEGRIPYIELSDGWYLIDWTWLYYPYNGNVLLTEVTWDNYNGEARFDHSTPHISAKNLIEKKGINVMDLVAYSYPDGNYPKYHFRYLNSDYEADLNEYYLIDQFECCGEEFLPRGGDDCWCDRVEEMDALWDLLRTQINTLIQNGDLYSLPRATQEQRLNIMYNN